MVLWLLSIVPNFDTPTHLVQKQPIFSGKGKEAGTPRAPAAFIVPRMRLGRSPLHPIA
jgi:hypothetical protein